jgi:hypothetical protein
MKKLNGLFKVASVALLLNLHCVSAISFAADNGVVILQREVPVRPAYREANPGRASVIDVSPDDKVRQMVNGQSVTRELQDDDFAQVTSGNAVAGDSLASIREASGLLDAHSGSRGLGSAAGSPTNTAQSIVPIVTGSVGPAVGAATGQIGTSVKGISGALNGLTGTFTRTGAP